MSTQVTFERGGERLRCDVTAIPDWDGFDKLIKYLEQSHGATVTDEIDGPDARRWTLTIDGVELELVHESDWGNTLVSTSPASDPLVEAIGNDLEARLAGTPAPTIEKSIEDRVSLEAASRGVMKQALETLGDPSADARIEARRDKHERRGELILLGRRAEKDAQNAREAQLEDREELRHYLTLRGAKESGDDVTFEATFGGEVRSVVARWATGSAEVTLSCGDETRSVSTRDGRLSSHALEEALASFA